MCSGTTLYFFGSGAGAGASGSWGWAGTCAGSAGADCGAGLAFMTEEACLVVEKASRSEVIMKMMAATVVNFVRNPIAPELPKSVWLDPPKAAPISAPFPA